MKEARGVVASRQARTSQQSLLKPQVPGYGRPRKMQHRGTVGVFFADIGIKIADFPPEGICGL